MRGAAKAGHTGSSSGGTAKLAPALAWGASRTLSYILRSAREAGKIGKRTPRRKDRPPGGAADGDHPEGLIGRKNDQFP